MTEGGQSPAKYPTVVIIALCLQGKTKYLFTHCYKMKNDIVN